MPVICKYQAPFAIIDLASASLSLWVFLLWHSRCGLGEIKYRMIYFIDRLINFYVCVCVCVCVVSFVVQKLLSLIRSQLFIFVFIFLTLGGGSKKI